MVGGTNINGPVQNILGDATLTYSLTRNALDVHFDEIHYIRTGAPFRDMSWSNLHVDSQGSFSQDTPSRSIDGSGVTPFQWTV